MASATPTTAGGTRPLFPDDAQLDWDDLPGPRQNWFSAPRWVVVANCVAFCVLIWWLALNLTRSSSARFPTGDAADIGLAALILFVSVVASALVIRLHAAGRAGLADLDPPSDSVRLGLVDPETGLAGRGAVEQLVLDSLRGDRPHGVVVLLCEVGRLEAVRDSLGYRAGDEALGIVGRRLTEAFQGRGCVGRLDGAVLAVVVTHFLSERDIALAADAVLDCLNTPVTLSSGHVVSVAGSVGYAVADVDDGAGRVISNARSALSQARREPRPSIAEFDPSTREKAVARLELEQDLRGALERGELEVHYQPVLDVTTGLADRFEALVRWPHRSRGMVHPVEFLSVAADCDLMPGIGAFVLRQAGLQAVQWSVSVGEPVTVSVNIDRQQLIDGSLARDLEAVLEEIGLPPGQLEVEFGERVLEGDHQDVDDVITALQQLNVLGVKLAVDDFGTSQASLVRLQRLSMVSTLKLDRVLIDGVDADTVDRRIVEAVVSLADSIGLAVVAEGVETSAQASTLGELGVKLQQGFHHRRPGPAADMTDLVGSARPVSDWAEPV